MLRAKAGDQVIVHFRNELAEETTIHWHGLRLPPEADGTPSSQTPVLPGAEYEYRFVAKDASSFWYHPLPHPRACRARHDGRPDGDALVSVYVGRRNNRRIIVGIKPVPKPAMVPAGASVAVQSRPKRPTRLVRTLDQQGVESGALVGVVHG